MHILALLSLLMYCAPVRACVLQEWTAGSSCHEGEGESAPAVLESGADHGCVPHEAGAHDDGCVCEQPKVSADRGQAGDAAVDWIASPLIAIDHLRPAQRAGHCDGTFRPPDFKPPGRSLPLLN